MESAIRLMAVLSFLILGVSHIVQPRAWARFFMRLHEWGSTGNYVNAFLTLIPGVLIVSFHNVWRGLPVVLTVIGWLYVIKSAIYFVFPDVGLRSIGRVREENVRGFVVAGSLLVAVAVLLLASMLAGPDGIIDST
ncbi:MAG: hypothetical protein ACYTGG_11390 [Planctomycetota bacterium]|jgi:hypothetical protein